MLNKLEVLSMIFMNNGFDLCGYSRVAEKTCRQNISIRDGLIFMIFTQNMIGDYYKRVLDEITVNVTEMSFISRFEMIFCLL
jgi:hypothetical protein